MNRHCTKHDLSDEQISRAAYLLLRQDATKQYNCNDCDFRYHMAIASQAIRKAIASGGIDRTVDSLMDIVTEAESKPIAEFKRKHTSPEPPQ